MSGRVAKGATGEAEIRILRLDQARAELGQRALERGLEDICYRTGLYGRDMSGTGIFQDRRLFALLFILFYPRHAADSGFVAVEGRGRGARILGYCVGSPDTRDQRLLSRRMAFAVYARLAFAFFFYRESWRLARKIVPWEVHLGSVPDDPLWVEYPAHLHFNVDPKLQRGGVGSRLLEALEARMRELGSRGIHLDTSNVNDKALPFYIKKGYAILKEGADGESLWPGFPQAHGVTFGKRLS